MRAMGLGGAADDAEFAFLSRERGLVHARTHPEGVEVKLAAPATATAQHPVMVRRGEKRAALSEAAWQLLTAGGALELPRHRGARKRDKERPIVLEVVAC
jgi:hypothetical protein